MVTPTQKAALEARLEKKEGQLALAEEQLESLLTGEPIEEYRFASGGGNLQWARRRSVKQLQDLIQDLESEIDAITARLTKRGIVSFTVRRTP